ncbi:MFS transporter [Pseudactinotalea sp. HY160]|uniref:MFS transporter n=1 Tax=Pseudactinotalea sp. HY160 TaxID=2654490 RepID=UPI00128B1EC3|nr:MFS transporter [Pseudactinotalea sp. HY160]
MTTAFTRLDDRSRRSSWLVWLVGIGVYFLAVLHRSSLGVAGPDAVERWNISATELGTFVMVQLGMYALMQVPSGLAIDRWGARKVLLTATLILGTAQLLFAIAPNYPLALGARALLGLGDSAVFIAVLRLAAMWFPKRRYAILTMATGLAGMAGNLAATVPLVLALDEFGWTRTFLFTGGISIVYSLLLLRPAVSAPYRELPPAPEPGATTATPSALREAAGNVRSSWARRETRLGFWTHQGTMTAGVVVSLVWGYPYLTEGLGYSAEAAASQLSIYVVANLVASFVIGPLAGRRPSWRTPMGLGISAACVLAVAVLAAWPSGRPPASVVTLVFVVLALGGPTSQIGFHLARDYNPAVRISTATGLVNAGGFTGAMIASLTVGVVLDVSSAGSATTIHDYRWAMASIAAIGAISTLAMLGSLMGVRAGVLARMSQGVDVVVPLTERSWDRGYRRILRSR